MQNEEFKTKSVEAYLDDLQKQIASNLIGPVSGIINGLANQDAKQIGDGILELAVQILHTQSLYDKATRIYGAPPELTITIERQKIDPSEYTERQAYLSEAVASLVTDDLEIETNVLLGINDRLHGRNGKRFENFPDQQIDFGRGWDLLLELSKGVEDAFLFGWTSGIFDPALEDSNPPYSGDEEVNGESLLALWQEGRALGLCYSLLNGDDTI